MKNVFLLVLALSFLTVNSYSQEDVLRPNESYGAINTYKVVTPWALGLEAGLSYNMYSADLSWVDATTGLPTTANSIFNIFESLEGMTPHIGIFVDYDLNDKFGLHFKMLYNAIKYGDNQDGIVDFTHYITGEYLGTDLANYEISYSYQLFNLEPYLRFNATPELYILLGPSIQFGFGNSEFNEIYTEDVDYLTYNTDLPDKGMSSKSFKTEDGFSETRTSINFGAGYKFKIDRNIFIAPQVIFNLGLSEFDDALLSNVNQQFTQPEKILTVSNQSVNQIRLSVTLWLENL